MTCSLGLQVVITHGSLAYETGYMVGTLVSTANEPPLVLFSFPNRYVCPVKRPRHVVFRLTANISRWFWFDPNQKVLTEARGNHRFDHCMSAVRINKGNTEHDLD